jgi:Cytochrome c554 and c-prime
MSGKTTRTSLWIANLAVFLLASYTRPVWGDSGCAECHRGISLKQSASHHANALRRFEGSQVAAALLDEGNRQDSEYAYKYEGNTVTVSDSNSIARATLEWAFGAGAQGMTPVGYLNGSYFEYRFSLYRILNRPATSPGHPKRIESMYFALGSFESSSDAMRCFNCHATGVVQGQSGNVRPGNPDLAEMTPGVTCERCHGPGTGHGAAVRAGRPVAEIRHAVFNSGRLPPKASIEVCGGCHRVPLPGTAPKEPEKDDPVSVRFQPIGLLASKCFQASGRLSCLSCHDAHGDADRSARYYTEKCLQCHPPAHTIVESGEIANAVPPSTACRRNQLQDCLPCHMRSTSPLQNLTFTDHRIRIY